MVASVVKMVMMFDGSNGDGDHGSIGGDGESPVMVMVKCEKQHKHR